MVDFEAFENIPSVIKELVRYNDGSIKDIGDRAIRSLDALTHPDVADNVTLGRAVEGKIIKPARRTRWTAYPAKHEIVIVEDLRNPRCVYVPAGQTYNIEGTLNQNQAQPENEALAA